MTSGSAPTPRPPSRSASLVRGLSARFRVSVVLLALAALLAVLPRAAWPSEPAVAPPTGDPSAAAATLERLNATPLPPRDPRRLAAELHGLPLEAVPLVRDAPTRDLEPGRVDRFWVTDLNTRRAFEISAELRLVTEHAYWYVELGRSVALDDLERSAAFFETQVYPLTHRYFGSERSPGVDGDPRIVVLNARLAGVAGYFSANDLYPRLTHPYSNERELVYLNLDALRPGSLAYDATLAHEFQHLVHASNNPVQETWVDEGSAELAAAVLTNAGARSVRTFANQPDVQLTAWSDHPATAGIHYQAAYAFLQYAMSQLGGPESLRLVLDGPARGAEAFDRALAARGDPRRFNDLFADFLVANLLDDPALADGRYGYDRLDLRAAIGARLAVGGDPLRGEVHQYGADYVELVGAGQDAVLEFRGSPTTRLVGAELPPGDQVWWSNRADNLDSRLTRVFDLSGLSSATLRFRLWYDIEPDYDWGYLLASRDGVAWTPLSGRHTTAENPTGNALGPGWTGRSGGGATPVWVEEEVDLTPYAGGPVWLCFAYVTDQGYNAQGLLVDDVALPEIGFFDDGSADQGWLAEGFFRSDTVVPQPYLLRLVLVQQGAVSVVDVPVDERGYGRYIIPGLGAATERAVAIVSALAPRTLQPAAYELALTAP